MDKFILPIYYIDMDHEKWIVAWICESILVCLHDWIIIVFNIECFIMMHGYIYMMIACQLIMMDLFDFNDYVMPKHDKWVICLLIFECIYVSWLCKIYAWCMNYMFELIIFWMFIIMIHALKWLLRCFGITNDLGIDQICRKVNMVQKGSHEPASHLPQVASRLGAVPNPRASG